MLKKFLIKKGNHYCFHLPKLYFGKKNVFEVRFILDEGCKYDLGDADNADINKLWGVSFGMHHKNSFRLGWNVIGSDTSATPNTMGDKSLALFYYAYNDGVLKYEQIGVINQGQLGNYLIKFDFDNNRIAITNIFNDSLPQYFPYTFPKFKLGYFLFPYFGGNRKATSDISIYVAAK